MSLKRTVLTALSAASLLLCISLCVLWFRSYRHGATSSGVGQADSFSLTHVEPLYWFISSPGKLTLCGQRGRNWDYPLNHHLDFHDFSYGGSWGSDGSLLWNASAPFWALVIVTGIAPAMQAVGYLRRRHVRTSRGFAPIYPHHVTSAEPSSARDASPAVKGGALHSRI